MPRSLEPPKQNTMHTRQAYLVRLLKRLGGVRLLLGLARVFYHLRVEGQEYIPTAGACLCAINHESTITAGLAYLIVSQRRPEVSVFAIQNLRGESPLFAFLQRFGETDLEKRFLRVYKGKGLSAGELLKAREILLRQGAVLLAPEGELTWDGRFQHPLTPGGAWLALHTGAPIVPIATCGGYTVQPRWRMDHLRLTGRITVRIGQPFRVSDSPLRLVRQEDLQLANQELETRIKSLLEPHQIGATS